MEKQKIQRNPKTGFPIAYVAGDLFPIPDDWVYVIHRTKSKDIDSFLKNGLDYTKYPTILSKADGINTDRFWEILTDDFRKNPKYKAKIVFAMPKSEFEYYKQEYSNGVVPVKYLVAILPNYGGTVPLKIQDTQGALFDNIPSIQAQFPPEFLGRDPQERLNANDIKRLKQMVSTRMLLPMFTASQAELKSRQEDKEDWEETGLPKRVAHLSPSQKPSRSK